MKASQWRHDHRWLLVAVIGTLLLQLWLCYFFSFGAVVPMTNDFTPGYLRSLQFQFPPQGFVSYDHWLGSANYPVPLTPFSVLTHLPVWLLLTMYYPLFGALAVASAYWLVRELNMSRPSALIGGLIYGWQGPMLSNICAGHFQPMALLALTPVAAVMALRAIRNRDWWATMVCGGVLGMNICLQPDHGMLVALLIGALYLVGIVRSTRHEPQHGIMLLGRLLMAIAVSALMALPTIQTMFQTQIAGVKQVSSTDPQQHWKWATQWSLPVTETLDYLVPGFFGWRSGYPEGPYWGQIGRQSGWEQQRQGFRNFTTTATSLGTVALMLALSGAWMVFRRQSHTGRNREAAPTKTPTGAQMLNADQLFYVRFFAVALAICYLLALGRHAPFYQFFYHLPYMGTWRNPIKFMVPGGLCLTVLAACGAQAMLTGFSPVALRRLLAGVSVVTGLVLFAALAANSWLTTSLISQGYSSPEITAAIGVAQLTAFVATLVVGLLWLALRKPSWCASLLAVLVVGQMTWVHSHYLDPFDFRSAHKTNALVDKIRSDPEPVRVKFLAQDGLLHYYLWAVFPYYRIASIDIPAASRIPDDYLAFFAALEKHPLRLWQLAGVKYLALPASLLNQVLQAPELRTNIASVETFQARGSRLDDLSVSAVTDPGLATHALVTLKDFLSKVTFVPGIEVLDDQAALSRRLASPEWDPWRTFLLDQSTAVTAGLTTLPTPVPGAMAKVLLRRYSGARIEVEVESKSAGYILINDRYDTKWRARVNGEPARIVRANLIMLGLQVPVGHSKIVLDYNCPTLPIYVHLVSLAGVLFSLFIYAWRTRRKTAADSGSS